MSNRKAAREMIVSRRNEQLNVKKNNDRLLSSKKEVVEYSESHPFRENFNGYLEQYINDKSNELFKIGIHDAGGGGDCLFHSISSGVKQAVYKGLETKNYTIEDLRNLVADYILSLDEQKFKELLNVYMVIENYLDWKEGWSPSSIKDKEQLSNEFRKTGNNHWGNEIDLKSLSEKLKIGFILFSNIEEQIYCFGQEFSFEKPRYYILLYNISNIHYTLAGLKKRNTESYDSIYEPNEIPTFLKNEYEFLCKCSL